MRRADVSHLTRLAPDLESGRLARGDAIALFTILRDEAAAGSIVRDIGDSVNDLGRADGAAHECLNTFADGLLLDAHNGGTLTVGTLYPIGRLITELHSHFGWIGIPFNAGAARSNKHQLALAFAGTFVGTTVQLRNGHLDAMMTIAPNGDPVCVFTPVGDLPWMFGAAGLAIPMFTDMVPSQPGTEATSPPSGSRR